MKNWLRKVAAWLWATKERMVLAVMVAVLVSRVYQVVQPPVSPAAGKNFQPPGSDESRLRERPGVPPRTPSPPSSGNWTNLWLTNPFTYVSPGDSSRRVIVEGREIDLELLSIQQIPDGSYRVQIRSPSRRAWYSEGDPFESYELVSIDPDTECIVIFAEEIGKPVEICK